MLKMRVGEGSLLTMQKAVAVVVEDSNVTCEFGSDIW